MHVCTVVYFILRVFFSWSVAGVHGLLGEYCLHIIGWFIFTTTG